MRLCPDCESPAVAYDDHVYVCATCDFEWRAEDPDPVQDYVDQFVGDWR